MVFAFKQHPPGQLHYFRLIQTSKRLLALAQWTPIYVKSLASLHMVLYFILPNFEYSLPNFRFTFYPTSDKNEVRSKKN